MYDVSAGFLEAMMRSHVTDVVCSVDGVLLRPTEGSVSVDANRAIRRTFSATFYDDTGTLIPNGIEGLLAPYGNEVSLFRGIKVGSAFEYVPLGVFLITDTEVSEDQNGVTISVSGSDRSQRVARARLSSVYSIPNNKNLKSAITDYIRNRWIDASIDLDDTTITVPAVAYDPGDSSDPWRDVYEMARSNGLDLYADVDGVFRWRPLPSATSTPIITYDEASSPVLLSINKSQSMTNVYNGVIVISENSQLAFPLRAERWIDNPNSPLYRYGPFGQVPYYKYVNTVYTQAQVEAAADAAVATMLGASEKLQWTQLVNPAHDVYDMVGIKRSNVNVDASYMIESLEIPLAPDQGMSATAKERLIT